MKKSISFIFLLFLFSCDIKPKLKSHTIKQYSKLITGKYNLLNSKNAGIEFVSSNIALWRNEFHNNDPDTLRIKWIDDETFLTIQMERNNNDCPPRVEVYKVESLKRNKLILVSIWTGWGKAKDEKLIFKKNKLNEVN